MWSMSDGRIEAVGRRYARVVTSEQLANLAHLRRARDLIDREYARPLDVEALARTALDVDALTSRGSSARRTGRRPTAT